MRTPRDFSLGIATPQIHWPAEYLPANTHVFASNEILISAPVEVVWAWLVRAESWPEWYANAKDIHFLSHAGPDLRDRSRFRWKTFGALITSKVMEFEPCSRLAWDAHGIGVQAWQAWVLTPIENAGERRSTHVLTAETQTGWRARLGNAVMPKRMSAMHQLWLEGLCAKAELGMPDAAQSRVQEHRGI